MGQVLFEYLRVCQCFYNVFNLFLEIGTRDPKTYERTLTNDTILTEIHKTRGYRFWARLSIRMLARLKGVTGGGMDLSSNVQKYKLNRTLG